MIPCSLSAAQVCMHVFECDEGSTWSSQLTPGYPPDWICSSSHGLSLSRPGCCMLQSELQVCSRKVELQLHRSFSSNRKFLRSSDLVRDYCGCTRPPPLHSSNQRPHSYDNPSPSPITSLAAEVAPPVTGNTVTVGQWFPTWGSRPPLGLTVGREAFLIFFLLILFYWFFIFLFCKYNWPISQNFIHMWRKLN